MIDYIYYYSFVFWLIIFLVINLLLFVLYFLIFYETFRLIFSASMILVFGIQFINVQQKHIMIFWCLLEVWIGLYIMDGLSSALYKAYFIFMRLFFIYLDIGVHDDIIHFSVICYLLILWLLIYFLFKLIRKLNYFALIYLLIFLNILLLCYCFYNLNQY